MGLCLGKAPGGYAASPSPHWPDLPPEIAGHIQSRLGSHDDRLSFAAVCPEWRLAARQHGPLQPPAIPCINLGNGTYQSITDSKVRPFATPEGYSAGASFGAGWLFYYNEGSGRCFVGAPFSGDAIDVPINYDKRSLVAITRDTMLIGRAVNMKMVMCSSRSQALVTIICPCRRRRRHYVDPLSYFASFRPAHRQETSGVLSLSLQPRDHHHGVYVYTDIAIYHGDVFALSPWEELFCHGNMDGHASHLPIICHDREARPAVTLLANSYLVVSSDKQKLLMVRSRKRGNTAMDVWVFEADFVAGKWVEVKDLGDQVLFLGRNSSMAYAACSLEHWGRSFLRGNRVFVLGNEWPSSLGQPLPFKRDIPSYYMYDMVSGETSLVRLHGARYKESCRSGWFFP